MDKTIKTLQAAFVASILLVLLAAIPACAAQRTLALDGLTGGGAGKLDAVYAGGRTGYYDALAEGDTVTAYDPTTMEEMTYEFHIFSSPQKTSVPDIIVPLYQSPEVPYTGNGAWRLVSKRVNTLTAKLINQVRTPGESGLLRLYEDPNNGDNYAQLGANAAMTDNVILNLPSGMPAKTSVLGSSPAGNTYWAPQDEYVCFAVENSNEYVEVGDGTKAFVIPANLAGYELVGATASVATPGGVSGTTDIQIRRRRAGSNADMLSTKITLSTSEHTASDGVINPSYDDLNQGDMVFIDVDQVCSAPPMGLSVTLTMRKP